MNTNRGGPVVALDIGASKVCCFIAQHQDGRWKVTGIGNQISGGMKNGNVTDMDTVEASVRAAVDAAERMAEQTVRDVYVSFSGGHQESINYHVDVAINGHAVSERDLDAVRDPGHAPDLGEGREILHILPITYGIDGDDGIMDPRGMYGNNLGVDLHLITNQIAAARNLRIAVEKCHLKVAGFVSSALASGLGSLVEDERNLGVALVDMGGGTTKIGIFHEGTMIHGSSIPVGGAHVSSDIARGLSTSLANAERLKTLYGNVMVAPADDGEMIDVPRMGESGADNIDSIPLSLLSGIIRPRIEETLELVRERIETSGFEKLVGRRVVLTGGAAMLQGMPQLAHQILDKQVRIGRPRGIGGLAEVTSGPAFSACAGLLNYVSRFGTERVAQPAETAPAVQSPLKRAARWLRENF